jgi:hypothetical protein
VNHLALDILIAVLTNNDDGARRGDLFLRNAVPCSSPIGEFDGSDAAGLELRNESVGKEYRVFIGNVLSRDFQVQAFGI